MATYREIQEYVKGKYNISVKTCWIADMKEICGLLKKVSANRINENFKTNPCPVDKQVIIKEAFRYFNMIE